MSAAAAELSDAQLLGADDERAFAVFFERHFATLFRYLASRYGQALAESICSRVFEVAWRQRSRYVAEHASAAPWLFGIARNFTRTELRAERRHLRRVASAAAVFESQSSGHESEVEGRLEAWELTPRITRVLLSVNRDQREALLLYAIAERSYQEIAELQGVPVGTVRSRINSARTALREELADERTR